MSVTFLGPEWHYEVDRGEEPGINLSNANACAVMESLGLPAEPCGKIKASELAARCLRRLMHEVGAPVMDTVDLLFHAILDLSVPKSAAVVKELAKND